MKHKEKAEWGDEWGLHGQGEDKMPTVVHSWRGGSSGTTREALMPPRAERRASVPVPVPALLG